MAAGAQDYEDDLPALKLTCTSVDCENGTHCFKPKKPRSKKAKEQQALCPVPLGTCRACGAFVTDLTRLHRRDPQDMEHTLATVQLETFRHSYWTRPVDDRALAKAWKAGFTILRETAAKRMRHKDICSPQSEIYRDGMQTGLDGDVIFYAQHAVGSCCRGCMSYMHGIPSDRPLTEGEMDYFVTLMMQYLATRLPHLASATRIDSHATT